MELTETDILIIGGGAAGMMAAAGAARAMKERKCKARTIILEKMPRPGRKLMITGKGRCNFTNAKTWEAFSQHIHPKPNPLKPAFMTLSPQAVMDFFAENGLESVVERGDRVFPASGRASDVVDALENAVRQSGAELICNKEVSQISTLSDNCTDGQSNIEAADAEATDGKAAAAEAIYAEAKDVDAEAIYAEVTDGKAADAETMDAEDKRFRVTCSDGSQYICKKLIIATGGLSYPSTGSTGDGYSYAKSFGHSIRPCFPSLTALVPKGYKSICNTKDKNSKDECLKDKNLKDECLKDKSLRDECMKDKNAKDEIFKGCNAPQLKGHIDRAVPLSEIGATLNGNSLKNIGLTILIDGNEVSDDFGDIDFTDGGIEGPLGFKASRRCVNAIINGSRVAAVIDMKPAVKKEQLEKRITDLWKEICDDRRSLGKSRDEKFMILIGKLLPRPLVKGFFRCCRPTDFKSLASALKAWKFDIAGYVGYERCVVTAGGVQTNEIVSKTLESKMQRGLYFAGELLDLDADTGGYNLQTAFSTGFLAGRSAALTLQHDSLAAE